MPTSPSTNHDLEPVPSRAWRMGWIVVLCGLAFIGRTPWTAKIVFAVLSVLVFGTYRRFRLTPKSVMERWTIAFIDLPHRSRKWQKCTFLEVKYESPTGMLEFLLFGPIAFFWGWIVDLCFPWMGGAYQIWFNNEADDRVLAWQGNRQVHYERNVELLESATGLRVRMR
jgi:hypothetical protein